MKIRRCAIVLIEPREKLAFNLESLSNGGDGLDAQIELLALAPHLDGEVPVTAEQVAVLNALVAAPWREFDELAQQHDAHVLEGLLDMGLLIGDGEAHAAVRARDDALRAANWHAHSAVAHYFGRWRGVTSGEDLAKSGVYTMSELFARLGAPPPHVHERVSAHERIALPQPAPTAVDDLLARRATCRNFDPARALPQALFAQLMQRVFAAQAEVRVGDDTAFLKKNSPSGNRLRGQGGWLPAGIEGSTGNGHRQEGRSSRDGKGLYAASFSPAMPHTISAMQPSRIAVAGSPSNQTPSSAVPTVPMPVHTA